MRQVVAAIFLGVVGVLGFAASGTLFAGTSVISDRTIFCTEFVPNAQAESNYNKWLAQNPGEAARWTSFRNPACSGTNPTPPSMTTPKGRGLVASGKMALDEAPPTTTTTPPPTTTTLPPPTTQKANIWISP